MEYNVSKSNPITQFRKGKIFNPSNIILIFILNLTTKIVKWSMAMFVGGVRELRRQDAEVDHRLPSAITLSWGERPTPSLHRVQKSEVNIYFYEY